MQLCLLTCVDQFSDIPGGDVFSCEPDEDGNLDTSADFSRKMVDSQKTQRQSSAKMRQIGGQRKRYRKKSMVSIIVFIYKSCTILNMSSH